MENSLGLSFKWGATHKRGGRLVVRQTSVDPPKWCGKCRYILKYMYKAWSYMLLMGYHKFRAEYAEEFPDDNIAWKYRTGEDPPDNFWSSIWEIIILKTRRRLTWLKHKL